MQLFLRFLVGGVFVSLFAILGNSFKPKSFAGLFGAAPSIALSGLILVWLHDGRPDMITQAHSMIYGALAMVLYSLTCAVAVASTRFPPWLSTGILWGEWFTAAFIMYKVFLK